MPKYSLSSARTRRSSLSSFVGLALLLGLLSVASVIGLWLVSRPQELRQRAAEGSRQVAVTMKGRAITEGNTAKLVVDLMMNTQSLSVAGVELRGTISGAKSDRVAWDTSNPLNLETIVSKLEPSGDNTKFVLSQFAPLDVSKKVTTSGREEKFASLTVSDVANKSIVVAIEQPSYIPLVGGESVTVNWPGPQTFQIQVQNTTPTNKGPQRQCNEYCADSTDCDSKYTCYFNRCRNPKNQTSTTCSDTPIRSTPPKAAVTTPTPKASPSPTPSPIVLSPSPTATASAMLYERDLQPGFLYTPSPVSSPVVVVVASPSPTPAPVAAQTGSSAGRLIFLVIGLVALGGLGFLIYRVFIRR